MEYVSSIPWIVINCVIIGLCVAGNLLTLLAIRTSRQLASFISNQFIFSLAVSDLFVGLTIPYHMCFYMLHSQLGHNRNTCLVRFVLISFSCSSSIINLFLIATDRYFAIVYPLLYKKYMVRRNSTWAILIGWFCSLTLSTVLIFWNHWDPGVDCDVNIIPASYFLGVLTPLFLLVWSAIFVVYLKIWRETRRHTKRLLMNNGVNSKANINESKSVQVVLLTLGCFSLCWMPYFAVTTYYRIGHNGSNFSLLYEIAFTLAVANSAMNPLIYAWKNSNYRQAFINLLQCRSPNCKSATKVDFITDHVPKVTNNNEERTESVSTDATSVDLTTRIIVN